MEFNRRGNLVPSANKKLNIISDGDEYYMVEPLSTQFERSKGGNSFVFKAIDSNDEEFVVKFSKFPNTEENKKENDRFQHEINALYHANEVGLTNVVKIYFDGFKKIGGQSYQYYVMEKGEQDLRSYLMRNRVIPSQKYKLCYDILTGIKDLHSIGLYHRDIKPDNIFIIGGEAGTWKVGDLGLSVYRDEDLRALELRERIGPYGWLSPEATNKVFCEGTRFEHDFDCEIDDMSDIFQLGKVLWFIFQNNIPVGQVTFDDFKLNKPEIFNLLFQMLQYNKGRRGDIDYYREEFNLLSN